ncbi:TPA: nuclease [Candidatus Poribacteria bacterium]|nr:nuclease [Candidatus Poribacteria bacterium]HEX30849.1 nuclease [Candidatus Poribacteria bacterium]
MRRKWLIPSVFLILLAAIGGLLLSSRGDEKLLKCHVVRVIDGDTVAVTVEGERGERMVRYLGIDAPERGKDGEPGEPFAEEAFEYNKALVEGKTVWLEFDKRRKDKYDRLLAYVYLDPLKLSMVNAIFLSQGYATLMIIPPNVKYADQFEMLQREAKEEELGLWWRIPDITVEELENNLKKYLYKICAVRFKVERTFKSKKSGTIFLNSKAKEYYKHFTVVIFSDTVKKFQKMGIEPEEYYLNKRIRVTGRVEFYKKGRYRYPEIIVRDPSQISVGRVKSRP